MPSPPDTAPPTAIDDLILAEAGADWCKVAVFIAKVMDAATARGLAITGQAVAQRIYAMAEGGRLEAKGNVRRWRAGEIRKAA